MSDTETDVRERANNACELCTNGDDLKLWVVEPAPEGAAGAVLTCGVCRGQLEAGEVDAEHFRYVLQGTIWSEVAAVQALSWRLLHQIDAEWARDVLDSAYLEDDVLAWAKAGLPDDPTDDRPPAFDSNGTALADGDSVTLIKDLDVKGANFTAKRGTLVKGIRLTADPDLVEGRVNKVAIFLRTEFLKRV